MKKIVFNLIAIVMFSFVGNAQDVNKIVNDKNWQTIVNNNVKILDLLVNSNVDLKDKKTINSNEFYNKIGIKKSEALLILEQSKNAAKELNAKYFEKSEQCSECAVISDAKWEQIVNQIELFRKDKKAYQEFLQAIGYNSINAKVNCNNWRFYMCGGACVITCEVPPVFAGCLMMCAAEFC